MLRTFGIWNWHRFSNPSNDGLKVGCQRVTEPVSHLFCINFQFPTNGTFVLKTRQMYSIFLILQWEMKKKLKGLCCAGLCSRFALRFCSRFALRFCSRFWVCASLCCRFALRFVRGSGFEVLGAAETERVRAEGGEPRFLGRRRPSGVEGVA
jgi:hypothetical protein